MILEVTQIIQFYVICRVLNNHVNVLKILKEINKHTLEYTLSPNLQDVNMS